MELSVGKEVVEASLVTSAGIEVALAAAEAVFLLGSSRGTARRG